MKGLLLKDFFNIKSFGKITLVILLLYVGIAVYTNDPGFFSALLFVFCAMLPLTSQSLDEQSKWGAYAQCMPVSRAQVVMARYLMTVLLIALAIIVAAVISAVTALRGGGVWLDMVLTQAATGSILLVFNAIILPLMYKLGAEKSRWVVMLLMIGCGAPVMMGWIDVSTLESLSSLPLYMVPIVAIALYVASYFISVRIYQKKEL